MVFVALFVRIGMFVALRNVRTMWANLYDNFFPIENVTGMNVKF